MRHQKGRRDCSYNSSLHCLSFTDCLSAILVPIKKKTKPDCIPSFFLAESAVWLSLLPCCCFPAPLLLPPGFAFTLTKPTQPLLSLLPRGQSCVPSVSSAGCSRGGSSLCCLPAPGTALGTTSLLGGPGEGRLWPVQGSLSFLLPDTLGSPLFSALQSPLL